MASKRATKATARVTKTSKGFSIRTYEPPPADFDATTAAPRLLLRHGLPTRPDATKEPELRARWDKAFARPMTWIVPEFQEMTGREHGPAIRPGRRGRAPVKAAAGVANATSGNWSGMVVFPPAGKTFKWVEGQWTVPNPHAPGVGTFYASEWIGIDGWNSGDVLQAGTETEATNLVIVHSTSVYAWWEWYPAGEVAIQNFAVQPGDVMVCLICVNSTTTATIYLTNQSSGLSTSFSITAPQGTQLAGDSAEWIVERPTVNGNLASLTDYDVVYMDDGIAEWTGGGQSGLSTSGTGTSVTMTGGGNAALSVPTIETAQLTKFDWKKAN